MYLYMYIIVISIVRIFLWIVYVYVSDLYDDDVGHMLLLYVCLLVCLFVPLFIGDSFCCCYRHPRAAMPPIAWHNLYFEECFV